MSLVMVSKVLAASTLPNISKLDIFKTSKVLFIILIVSTMLPPFFKNSGIVVSFNSLKYSFTVLSLLENSERIAPIPVEASAVR